MNADLYRSVIDALAPFLVKRAHLNQALPKREYWQPKEDRPASEPEFDAVLNLDPFAKMLKQKRVNSAVSNAVRNCITLLCRDAVEHVHVTQGLTGEFPNEYRTDLMHIRFRHRSIALGQKPSGRHVYGLRHADTNINYNELVIGSRSYSPDYFGLISFRQQEENVKEEEVTTE